MPAAAGAGVAADDDDEINKYAYFPTS